MNTRSLHPIDAMNICHVAVPPGAEINFKIVPASEDSPVVPVCLDLETTKFELVDMFRDDNTWISMVVSRERVDKQDRFTLRPIIFTPGEHIIFAFVNRSEDDIAFKAQLHRRSLTEEESMKVKTKGLSSPVCPVMCSTSKDSNIATEPAPNPSACACGEKERCDACYLARGPLPPSGLPGDNHKETSSWLRDLISESLKNAFAALGKMSDKPEDRKDVPPFLGDSLWEDDYPHEIPKLFGRCLSWFREGVVAALLDADMAPMAPIDHDRPARIRDSVRSFAESVLGAAEIPFMMASLGAKSLTEISRGVPPTEIFDRKIGTLGIPPVKVEGGKRATLVLETTMWCVPRFLRLDYNGFHILDVKSGRNSILLGSNAPISEVFAFEGIKLSALEEAVPPGTIISITIESVLTETVSVSGVLECELYLSRPERL